MPSVTQREPTEFFVVGGPVQAERPCYVEREADRRLEAALRDKRLCCVLGPPAIGKSSLLLRAARSLRAAGALVATIDLRRIADQGAAESGDSLRRVAERVAAELKLGIDVAHWWRNRGAVGDNRLAEFFWEVVLTNTTAPIVVLIDEIDSALESSLGAELLEAVGACYARRARESDFARLGFALAGSVSQGELQEESAAAVFADPEVVEPDDFNAEESYRFAVAFGGEQELAQALLDRIRAWTGGHPYLTQRVARGVARKGGRLEDVERVVREQLLAPGAADKDPLLTQVRAWLGEPARPARRAMQLLQKLANGGKVVRPADAAVWDRLWLSGTVVADGERTLRVRNRIVKELVATRWLKAKRSAWRWAAAAAVLLAVAAGGGYWYTQRLPVSDIETLTSATAQPSAVENAYRRLRGLPGFAERADALWLAALTRQSRAATALADATAADTRLRALPGQGAAADTLLSEFWLRRARGATHAEQRDAAILLAQRAAALPSADPTAAVMLAELVGDDYSRLERSLRLPAVPEYWHMAFAQDALVTIDAEQRAQRTPFGAAAGTDALGAAPVKLTALTHTALARELLVDGEGTAGELELTLSVQHPAAAELLVTLTAPSGAEAAVSVPRSDGSLVETFSFQAAEGSPLAQLADEGLRGAWRLTIVDRAGGNTGTFGGWGLRFGDTVVRDDVFEGLAIPDATRVESVSVRAVGERAVAWPVEVGAIGSVALWNLTTGQLEHDFTLPAAPQQVALDVTGTRLLAATNRVLQLWSVADGAPVGRVTTETEFVLPPVFSADGGYVAIAERVDGANPLYSVLRSADASLVATIEGLPDAQGWELGPGGRYVALQGPETVVRVLETRRGAELARLGHVQAVERLLHTSDGTTLVTVDRLGAIAVWPLGTASAVARPLGRTAAADTISASADGRRIAFTRDDGAVVLVDVATGAELYRLRLPRSSVATRTQLSADGVQLVTQSATALKLWSLPAKPAAATAARDVLPTALALDRTGDVLAVGFASGQLQISPVAAAGAGSPLAYFGHRGRITAVALNAGRGLAATGGADGIVRVWDVASGAPTGVVAQPADAAIALVALSDDGRYVAGVSERTVRIAGVTDGLVTAEVQAEAPVTAIAFAPDGASVVVGDAVGTVLLARFAEPNGSAGARVRLTSAVTSLAFVPDGSRIAVGAAGGSIALVDVASGDRQNMGRTWSQPIRWLGFSNDGGTLLVATDAWLHALAATTPALEPLQSRLAAWPSSEMVATALSATAIGVAGIASDGSLVSSVLDAAAGDGGASDGAAFVARDWQTAFALRLNDNGEPVPFDP